MLPSIRLDDIETVINVTECKHFTRAGTKLHRHQTTVSKSIKRIEDHLGLKLVDRSAHPVRPTKGGAAFAYYARKGLDSLERGIAEARRASVTSNSVLQVGYTSYLDLELLTHIADMGKAANGGFSHKEHSSSSSEIVASILARKWDCGFIVSPSATGGLAGIPVYLDPFGLIVANDHPLARKKKVRIKDLRDVPVILPAKERNTGFRAWFLERCATEGVKLKIAQEVSNPHEAWFLASQHAGVALMPKSASGHLRKAATVFRPFVEEDLYIEVQLVFRDEPQIPMLALFVAAVQRMRERMQRSDQRDRPDQMPVVPRPAVKRWKRSQSGRSGSDAGCAQVSKPLQQSTIASAVREISLPGSSSLPSAD